MPTPYRRVMPRPYRRVMPSPFALRLRTALNEVKGLRVNSARNLALLPG